MKVIFLKNDIVICLKSIIVNIIIRNDPSKLYFIVPIDNRKGRKTSDQNYVLFEIDHSITSWHLLLGEKRIYNSWQSN